MSHNGTVKPFLNNINFSEVKFIMQIPEHGSVGCRTKEEVEEALTSNFYNPNGERECYITTIEEYKENVLDGNGLIVNEEGFLLDAE